MAKKVLTEEEKKNHEDFLAVCGYIERELLGYEKNQKLQKMAALKVQGMAKGQNIANNNCQKYGEYPFEVVLMTLKINKNIIINALQKKNFQNESNAVSYISAIVRDRINNIYKNYINAKKTQEKSENISTDIMEYNGAEYKPMRNNKNEDKFKELW